MMLQTAGSHLTATLSVFPSTFVIDQQISGSSPTPLTPVAGEGNAPIYFLSGDANGSTHR